MRRILTFMLGQHCSIKMATSGPAVMLKTRHTDQATVQNELQYSRL